MRSWATESIIKQMTAINQAIKKIITDYLNIEFDINSYDNIFDDLECDAEGMVDILNLLDAEFEINIGFAEGCRLETVQDIIDSVNYLLLNTPRTLH